MNINKLAKFSTTGVGRPATPRFFNMDDGTVVTGTLQEFLHCLNSVMTESEIKNLFYGRRKSPFATLIATPSSSLKVSAVSLADYLQS